jgi:glycosyltransferase involved in cell wall biosynthesis
MMKNHNTAPFLGKSSTMHLAPGHWAGHMRIYHRECLSLARAGYPVELIAHSLKGEFLNGNVTLHSLGDYDGSTLSWRIARRVSRCRRAYQLARRSKAAVFHYHSPEFIPWAIGLQKSAGRPVIFDCMEDFEAYCHQRGGIPKQLRGVVAGVVRRLLSMAAQHCDTVIVPDKGTARFFERCARRVLVLHNFPELILFPEELAKIETERSYDIVYHGSLPRYHLETCLAIDKALVERGRHVRWRFIGNIADLDWFSQELHRRCIFHRFHISGLMPHNQIGGEVRRAKVGLIPLPDLPKFHTNIPQKLFEFMALGMPVVLSDLPPSREFVGDGSCAILVAPGDYEAYAGAILRLLDNPSLCRQMGSEGRQRVQDQYNWEKESLKLINLYKEIVG